MKYAIIVCDYQLDENGIVVDSDGGSLTFNDADDFIMMWKYFKGAGQDKDIFDDGVTLLVQPREIGPFVTDYQITGDAYKLWKEWEAKENERYSKNNNEEDLPF